MSWGLLGGAALGVVGSAVSSRSAGKSAERAARTSADYQMAGLNYLKETDAAPMAYRDQALAALASEYGLSPYEGPPAGGYNAENGIVTGTRMERYENPEYKAPEVSDFITSVSGPREHRGIISNSPAVPKYLSREVDVYGRDPNAPAGQPVQSITDRAYSSPLYAAIMSGRDAGEQSIARSGLATGGLRGGQSISDLTTYNTNLQNQALLTSRQDIMSGLQGLAGHQTMAPQIASQYSNIGQTLGQGQVAAGQARQQGYAGIANAIGGGINAYYGQQQRGAV